MNIFMDDLISKFVYSLKEKSIGPEKGSTEIITECPNKKYYVGMLSPQNKEIQKGDDEDNSERDEQNNLHDDITEDETVKKQSQNISSAGLTFSSKSGVLKVLVSYGRYSKLEDGKYLRYPYNKMLNINLENGINIFLVEDDDLINVNVKVIKKRESIKIILINELKDKRTKIKYEDIWKYTLYQVSLRINTNNSLIGMEPKRFTDERLIALYSERKSYGIGQNCTAIWNELDIENKKDSKEDRILNWTDYTDQFEEFYNPDIRTEFIPLYQAITPKSVELNVDLSAKCLVNDGYAEVLEGVVNSYEKWIGNIEKRLGESKSNYNSELYSELLKNIENNKYILKRIRNGIDILAKNKIADKSFKFVNAVIDKVGNWRNYEKDFEWRPFQLAFLLMEIYDIVNKKSETRELVDVLWVHTGAGKTEAYLSVAMFDIIYRRYVMQSQNKKDINPGTSVISRYTLRLLTVQQFKRTMEVITAAELIRNVGYGKNEFFDGSHFQISGGLWVGNNLTPNNMPSAKKYVSEIALYSSDSQYDEGNPAQILKCPSCKAFLAIPKDQGLKKGDSYYIKVAQVNLHEEISGSDFYIQPLKNGVFKLTAKRDLSFNKIRESADIISLNIKDLSRILLPGYEINKERPARIEISCNNPECEINITGIKIPSYTVDDEIYRIHPSFIISTVDKIARLSFSSKAFELLRSEDSEGPDLIIQDEMHLLNGPLGSLFGIYENAVSLILKDKNVKYIAASATINKFEKQVGSLFSRGAVLFPPGGISSSDSFYFKEVEGGLHKNKINPYFPGRLYLGLMTTSTSLQSVLVSVISEILNIKYGHKDHEDIKYYWTPVLYFNSLKELSVAGSLYREDVMQRIKTSSSLELDPENFQELSSRASSTEIPVILDRLERWDGEPEKNPDALITTSMFGTGVDISRFSLMVVSGQPKMTAEYIQATGRTGRNRNSLVIILYNAFKPRDKSHYEMFLQYHDKIQANVESSPVSPWSSGSMNLAAGPAFVAYARAMCKNVREQNDASKISENLEVKEQFLKLTDDRITKFNRDVSNIIYSYGEIIQKWYDTAKEVQNMAYKSSEFAKKGEVTDGIVLGSPSDRYRSKMPKVVYENAPQSLREIEETGSFDNVDIRRSQFVFGYGPGSIVEGKKMSSAIQKESIYKINRTDKNAIIKAFDITSRIAQSTIQSVTNFAGKSDRNQNNNIRILELPSDQAIGGSMKGHISLTGNSLYKTSYFPEWRICLNENNHGKIDGKSVSVLYLSAENNQQCPICKSIKFSSQTRFVMACPNGHLDDVNWNLAINKSNKLINYFYLYSGGSSLESMKIIHPVTGVSKTMREIYSTNFKCTGRYVEYSKGSTVKSNCECLMKVIQRQSSSIRFPESFMYLNIPENDDFHLNYVDRENILTLLKDIDTPDDPDYAKHINRFIESFIGKEKYDEMFSQLDISEIEGLRELRKLLTLYKDENFNVETIMTREFQYLYDLIENGKEQDKEKMNFSPSKGYNFDYIKEFKYGSIEMVETVIIQTGYRRNIRNNVSKNSEPQIVSSSFKFMGNEYFPGIINNGDAIFIYLKTKDMEKIMQDDINIEESWDSKKVQNNTKWGVYTHSVKFVFLHTLSHALIKEISDSTGYSITSLRERVYSTSAGYGILIYTSGPGSDGSIGGLSDLVKDGMLKNILREAMNHYIRNCSNDPFCSSKNIDIESLNGAACYSCILLPETSCEYGNKFLSRNSWRND